MLSIFMMIAFKLLQKLVLICIAVGLSAQQLLLTPIEYDASFDVRWQENWNIKQHCSTCDFLSKIAGTSIYKLTDDQLLAVYSLSQGEGAILISDKQANSLYFLPELAGSMMTVFLY